MMRVIPALEDGAATAGVHLNRPCGVCVGGGVGGGGRGHCAADPAAPGPLIVHHRKVLNADDLRLLGSHTQGHVLPVGGDHRLHQDLGAAGHGVHDRLIDRGDSPPAIESGTWAPRSCPIPHHADDPENVRMRFVPVLYRPILPAPVRNRCKNSAPRFDVEYRPWRRHASNRAACSRRRPYIKAPAQATGAKTQAWHSQ